MGSAAGAHGPRDVTRCRVSARARAAPLLITFTTAKGKLFMSCPGVTSLHPAPRHPLALRGTLTPFLSPP
ncbi:hypothetical protein RR46_08660 [Papilio xuthus]|uniref:Uncharacterized protein n=1 Tax=Papilio xuthus TaxID=66420 RepID=A0A194Q7X3_PAPXU|nr:hypothetical protein RR46_08660 [Papilio xuthus]